jgi:hypothetical protein
MAGVNCGSGIENTSGTVPCRDVVTGDSAETSAEVSEASLGGRPSSAPFRLTFSSALLAMTLGWKSAPRERPTR